MLFAVASVAVSVPQALVGAVLVFRNVRSLVRSVVRMTVMVWMMTVVMTRVLVHVLVRFFQLHVICIRTELLNSSQISINSGDASTFIVLDVVASSVDIGGRRSGWEDAEESGRRLRACQVHLRHQ